MELFNRRHAQSAAIKGDVDLLVDPCSVAFAQSAKHYIDYAPGMPPDADDDGKTVGSMCHVDEGAGESQELLSPVSVKSLHHLP